jgi:V/A-type H+-transporting ATPase subunit A
MDERIIGQVRRVNGPVIEATGVTDAMMLELVRVGEVRLVGETIKLAGESAIIQVYEDTTGIAPGDNIYGSGSPLSVELGPGLIGTIYDGIQRPLEHIRNLSGSFIERGISLPSLDRDRKWRFRPAALKPGQEVQAGMVLGTVQETEGVEHRILCPPGLAGTLKSLAGEGDYTVSEPIGAVRNGIG